MTTPAEAGLSIEQQPIPRTGFCLLYTDQGAPGRHLAFQDRSVKPKGSEEFSFEGLHLLKPGDKLRIFLPSGGRNPLEHEDVAWEGKVSSEHELTSHDRFKRWVSADPTGKRAAWIEYFLKEYPAELTIG